MVTAVRVTEISTRNRGTKFPTLQACKEHVIKVILVHAMKTYRGVEVQVLLFFTSA
jgi:hypothetical protein